MPSRNRDAFISSFPSYIPYINFSSLIALPRTSSTALNRNGKKYPCLLPSLGKELFWFVTVENDVQFSSVQFSRSVVSDSL